MPLPPEQIAKILQKDASLPATLKRDIRRTIASFFSLLRSEFVMMLQH